MATLNRGSDARLFWSGWEGCYGECNSHATWVVLPQRQSDSEFATQHAPQALSPRRSANRVSAANSKVYMPLKTHASRCRSSAQALRLPRGCGVLLAVFFEVGAL